MVFVFFFRKKRRKATEKNVGENAYRPHVDGHVVVIGGEELGSFVTEGTGGSSGKKLIFSMRKKIGGARKIFM